MAIKLIANYAKRLGLPGYSSHNFSVTVETELRDLGEVQGESTRLYGLLQDAVDREIQHVGFVPPGDYGMESDNISGPRQLNGHNGHDDRWNCSDSQKDLILKLVDEHSLDRNEVDHLARQRFGAGVKELNKLQASGLISELLETCNTGNRNGNRPRQKAAGKGGRR